MKILVFFTNSGLVASTFLSEKEENMKKFFALLLTVTLLSSLSISAFAMPNVVTPAWADPVTYGNINWHSGVLNLYNKDWEGHAEILAQLIHRYAGNYTDKNIQSAVAWTILNSFDSWAGQKSFEDVVKDFGYDKKESTKDASGNDLMPIARDVLVRWLAEKTGYADVGRIIPSSYTYLYTENNHCHFRLHGINDSKDEWNFSLVSPY